MPTRKHLRLRDTVTVIGFQCVTSLRSVHFKIRCRSNILLAGSLLALFAQPTFSQEVQREDPIVAVVGGKAITYSEFYRSSASKLVQVRNEEYTQTRRALAEL